MTVTDIVTELKKVATEQTKKTWLNHGAKEPCFGVKIEDMKKIQKRVKMDYKLALELYGTDIADAMYRAGLIADDAKMTQKDLQGWMKKSTWGMVSEYTVTWVAAGNSHGRELALEWIDAKDEKTASAGWCTYSSLLPTKEDQDLDLAEVKKLLARVEKTIHERRIARVIA
jgi:3-methyladenine DNA glycosylase AlkD